MVIKKIKDSEPALTKNEGKDVRYRKRKQQEKEANELYQEYLQQRNDEDRCLFYDREEPTDPAL